MSRLHLARQKSSLGVEKIPAWKLALLHMSSIRHLAACSVRGRNPSASVLGTSQSDVMDNSQSLSGMPMLSHTEPTTISSTAAASGLSTSTSSRWISPFASYSLTPAGNSDTEEVAEGTGPPITRSPVEHH